MPTYDVRDAIDPKTIPAGKLDGTGACLSDCHDSGIDYTFSGDR